MPSVKNKRLKNVLQEKQPSENQRLGQVQVLCLSSEVN